jgi:hypothetical protein
MVGSVGTFISPLVLGSILTASVYFLVLTAIVHGCTRTISSWPQLVFCVQAVCRFVFQETLNVISPQIIVISAALFLFLVREGDRYQGEVPPTTPL